MKKIFKKALGIGVVLLVSVFFVGGYVSGGHRTKVFLNDVLVSDLSRGDLTLLVEGYVSELGEKNVKIGEVVVSNKDLGLTFDVNQTKKKILKNMRFRLWGGESVNAKAEALVRSREGVVVRPVLNYDPQEVQTKINYVVARFKQEAKEAGLFWSEEQGWYVKEGQIGREVADENYIARQIFSDLLQNAGDLKVSNTYMVRYKKVFPEFTTSEAENMLASLRKDYLLAPVRVVTKGQEIGKVDFSDSKDWFDFDYKENQIYVEQEVLEDRVEKIAKAYESKLASVRLLDIEEFQSEYDGQTYLKAVLDADLQQANMVDRVALKRDILLAKSGAQVELQFHNRAVSIVSDIEGMEFPDLISYGKSDYSLGAYANRVHNVKTATALQDLTIIPQGSIYSFNRVGGWVTYAKGYKDGEVIFGSVAKYVAGGGVCQVSTTMYRAAVFAGLPIEARKNHSWDVSYYRDVYGVDAAVYPPGGLDLKFKNDTPGPILVHTYVDEENQNVYFEMYGTSDGRSVSLGEPDITWLGGGAKKIITAWKIVRSGGVIEEREIVSRYSL